MKGARWIVITTIVTATMSLGASNAFAATEVGNRCEANSSVIAGFEGILFPLGDGTSGALPASVPIPGIATQWTARKQGLDSFFERLKVLRLTSEPEKVAIVAESPREEVSHGHGTFSIRIPVQVGDRFGLNGPLGALACPPVAPGEIAGLTTANGSPGSTERFSEYVGGQAAVSVIVEPDADGDGYGDETQDKCPTNAALQAKCPPVVAKSEAEAKRKSIVVEVGVSSEALIDVYGQVGWGYKPSPKLKTAGAKPTRLIVGLSGPKKTVLPGKRVPFRVPLPKSVLRRLGKLTPKQSLTAKLTVSCTDLAGRVKHQRLDLKLKGQSASS
jgi:hypothetical protein